MQHSEIAESTPAVGRARPSLTFVSAAALAIADMIGIGVFTSLGFQVRDLTSGFSVVLLWLVGGLVALCGALCYAELATAFPAAGGEYNFLSRIYHRMLGFLAGWVSATVGFAAPVALAAMAFGEYFAGVLPGAPKLVFALAVVWGATLVLLSGARPSIYFTNAATIVKVALIVGLIIAGVAFGTPQPISFLPGPGDVDRILSAPFAISLVYVMYSYSGWNAATYMADEVRDPGRTLPRSLLAAVLIVTALYVGLNAVFLYVTPMAKLAGQIDVGLVAGEQIFGPGGGRAVGILICIGLVSAVKAMMWIGPRVTMAMGQDVPALAFFAQRSSLNVPARALLLQASIATLLLATDSFEAVLEFIQFSLICCSALAVLGVIVLRFTQPHLPRPYKVWAYPLAPLIFLAVTLFILFHLASSKPIQSLAGVALLLTGFVVYGLSSWRARPVSAGLAP